MQWPTNSQSMAENPFANNPFIPGRFLINLRRKLCSKYFIPAIGGC